MANVAFGQLKSWDDVSTGGGGDFLNMKDDGDYVLRFLTDIPYEYGVHWIDVGMNGQKSMRKVKCAGNWHDDPKDHCILCAKGPNFKPKKTFIANVLNRADGQCYAYEFGPQVFGQLKKCAKNPKWGDIRMYDIRITKDKNGKPNVYTSVPEPPIGPLTPEEAELAHDFSTNRMILDKLAAPYTNDEIRNKLEGYMSNQTGGADFSATTQFTQTSTQATAPAPAASFEAQANPAMPEFKFPDFN